MNVGIIGYGNIGKIREKVVKELYPETTFYKFDPAISDGEETPDAVIEKSDVVFICTPNDQNARLTIKALSKGKDVFCEKPPALTYDELLEVEKVYKANESRVLVYGFNHRQYDSIQKMKSVIDDPKTGNVLWMRGRYGKAMGDPNTSGWRSDVTKSGGGILLDQGIHMLDLMNWFGGGFDVVQSIITNTLWNVEGIEDNAFLNLYNTDKNISASLHSTMIEWRHIFSLEVVMEHGYVALNGLKTPSGSYGKEVLTIGEDKHSTGNDKTSTSIEFTNNNTWEKEVKDFFRCVFDKKAHTNISSALDVMKIINECYNSSYAKTFKDNK